MEINRAHTHNVSKRRSRFDTSLMERLLEEQDRKREWQRVELLARTRKLLKDYFQCKNVRAVYVIGSLVRQGDFYPFSDIDIAVEGLTKGYFRVICELEEILERSVDIITMESCGFKESIRRKGIRIL